MIVKIKRANVSVLFDDNTALKIVITNVFGKVHAALNITGRSQK